MKIDSLSALELLQLQAESVEELRRRNVVRTSNAPLGDYAEWLVTTTLGWQLADNSQKGFDATDLEGTRYQIKARRPTQRNPSRQLSAIRKLDQHLFDFVIAVIFREDFSVAEIWKVPHSTIADYARFSEHSHAHLLHMKGAILQDPSVTTINGFKVSPA